MRRPNLRIRVQLTVSVCLFTLVCLVSLAIAIYVLSRNTLLDLEVGNIDLHSRMIREECRQEFTDIYQSFSRLSYSSPVRDIYRNYTDIGTIEEAGSLLHDSFGLDRILLMMFYLPNGTEFLEIDSHVFNNRSGLSTPLLPLSYSAGHWNETVSQINKNGGAFVGPMRALQPIGGTELMISLTLPVLDETSSDALGSGDIIGYVTFLMNSLKVQSILSSVGLSTGTSDVGAAALCAARNNFTVLDQLIPFEINDTAVSNSSVYSSGLRVARSAALSSVVSTDSALISATDVIAVPPRIAMQIRKGETPVAEPNAGPYQSMISISPFTVLNSTYYVVVLQSHQGVFEMPHKLRVVIVVASSAIGGAMIVLTFLFVSFGARQILRLKMAATYERPAPSKYKFLPLPWWLRPSNRKLQPENGERGETQVPDKVPLRKHVRDELDDITERFNAMSNELRKQCRRLEDRVAARKAEIEQAREAADHANAAKSHFLARVTHELRNPLNGIIGTATLCLEETNVEHIHNSLKTIFKCGELLLNLMVDLLSFSKTEVENLHLESRDFTLNEIAAQLQVIFTEQCSARNIRLVVNTDENYNDYVFCGDTNRILQVIFNLMSNGIKFTPEGGRVQLDATASATDEWCTFWEDVGGSETGTEADADADASESFGSREPFRVPFMEPFELGRESIRESVRESAQESTKESLKESAKSGIGLVTERRPVQRRCRVLRFDVTDNGPGIAPDLQSRVFEEFVQGDISPHVKKSGVGLGLCICRQLAERMHGSVTLKSTVGKGSTFTFQLPLPYRVKDPQNTANGDEVLELTSYASMLRIADYQRESREDLVPSSGPAPEQTSPVGDLATAGEPLLSESAETRSARALRHRIPGAHKAREFLSRRKTNDTIPKHEGNDSTSASETSLSRLGRKYSFGKRKSHESSVQNASPPTPTPPVPTTVEIPSARPAILRKQSASERSISNSIRPGPSNALLLNQKLGAFLIDGAAASVNPTTSETSAPTNSCNSPNPPAATGRPLAEIKVLVVDDNSVNQEVMMRMLSLEGLKNIKVANDGTEALSRVTEANEEQSPFDIIFMDVQMPKMDGREATRIIRNDYQMGVPIVAVSAFANESNAEDCILAGMNLFLSKPVRRPHLREILQSLSSITGRESSEGSTPSTNSPEI